MASQEKFTRPTSVAEMNERLKFFATDEGWQKGLAYKPDPSDVFIVTPPKCGTTWMQQIVHGLRTCGSMDFDEITCVVPWINMAYDMGIDVYEPQVAHPKAFKTHTPLNELPQGGKYIIILRHPHDALLSHYHFFEDMFFEKGSIDITTFAREIHMPGRSIVKHIIGFWNRRKDKNVLVFCYETMKTNLAGTIEKVAEFIDIPLDDELKQIVLKQSDIKFMKEHQDKFEDKIFRLKRFPAMRLPLETHMHKIRTGNVGDSKTKIPDEIKKELDDIWKNEITPATGMNSYEDLRKELMN